MAKKQRVSVVGTVLTVEYPSISKKFVTDFSKYDASIKDQALAHGFKQKFGDAESGGTAQEKFEMVQRIHAGFLTSQWELTATIDLTPLICEAISRIKKVPLAKVAKSAEKAGAEKVREWGTNLEVKAEIAKIRAEKAAKLAEESEEEVEIDLT